MPDCPRDPTDEDLLRRIAAGDANALVRLFRRRRAEVYRFALHMCGSAANAEDVTQDVFMTVMRDAPRFDEGRGAGISWLLGITRNAVRRRLFRDRFLTPLIDTTEPLDVAVEHDPAVDIDRAAQIAAIRRAVLALPIKYREVVLLCDLEELSYSDAATVLGCAVGTVRSRLHRGRALLATKLGKATDARKPAIAIA